MVHYRNQILFLLLILNFIYEAIQLTTLIAEKTPKQFHSHFNYTTQNYPNNYTGEWLIRTNGDNHTIQANLAECDIESVTRKGKTMCSWDWDILAFYNVNTTGNATEYIYIKSTCCNGTLGHIHSSGSELYVKFTTDSSTSKKGFTISYQDFEPAENHTESSKSSQSTAESGSSTAATVGAVIGVLIGAVAVLLTIVVIRAVFLKKKNLSRVNSKD